MNLRWGLPELAVAHLHDAVLELLMAVEAPPERLLGQADRRIEVRFAAQPNLMPPPAASGTGSNAKPGRRAVAG
jgi:hypothetical protein